MLHATLLLGALCAPQVEAPDEKIIPELREAFSVAPETETFQVYAVLNERLSYADFEGQVESLPRGTRQLFVADRLRTFANERQGNVLQLLGVLEETGQVQNVRQLWITNTVRFTATEAAVQRIAALPEIDYIGWSPERDTAELHDAPCAAPVPAPTFGGGGFTTYYTQGFESGVPSEMSSSTTGCGQVIVTGLYGPKTGSWAPRARLDHGQLRQHGDRRAGDRPERCHHRAPALRSQGHG